MRLNRPEALNALSAALKDERCATRSPPPPPTPAVRCVLLTGAGRAFCAGGDVKELANARTPLAVRTGMRRTLDTIVVPLARMPKPVIAAVNGFAVGAGFNIALAADIIVAAESAVFSQIFVQVALVPDYGGLYFLTRAVGLNRAKELCFTGRKLSAREGAEFGFVNRVVPDAELMDAATALARQIARGPSTSLSLTKSAPERGLDLLAGADGGAGGVRPSPCRDRSRPPGGAARVRREACAGVPSGAHLLTGRPAPSPLAGRFSATATGARS